MDGGRFYTITMHILNKLSLDEKCSLLAGADNWRTVALKDKGIPPLKTTDGPNGARGDVFEGGMRAFCFPCASNLGGTWDADAVREIGLALGTETKRKAAVVLLGPTLNIHRSPLGGRDFESFSEDPHLSGILSACYVNGVQEQGVAATPKHFVCNDVETRRQNVDVTISERALREIYLKPFQMILRDADPWALMTAYNSLNGTFCSENRRLLYDILRKEWGFKGLIMSDWSGTYSTAPSVNAGLDLEMPGPTQVRGPKLVEAVRNGEVDEATIDERVMKVVDLLDKTGKFVHPDEPEEKSVIDPELQKLARQTAAEGMVLLKNEGAILPLSKKTSVAVIGYPGGHATLSGGGSASLNAQYEVSPLDGIKKECTAKVTYSFGVPTYNALPLPDAKEVSPIKFEIFNDDMKKAVETTTVEIPQRILQGGQVPKGVNGNRYVGRMTFTLTPAESGVHLVAISSPGKARLSIDKEEVVSKKESEHTDPIGYIFDKRSTEETVEREFEKGRKYQLQFDFWSARENVPEGSDFFMVNGGRFGFLRKPETSMSQAADAAAAADVALVFVGTNKEFESEGYDRPHMHLSRGQDELVETVVAANPKTVVVNFSGAPVTMPWSDRVPTIVQAFFPGQECGNAVADVLYGNVDACGRLPTTYPVKLEDNPSYGNFPGENDKIHYAEGLFVGYRHYEQNRVPTLFPVGHGLSYTKFAWSRFGVSGDMSPRGTIDATLRVENVGERKGKEVVQVYIRPVRPSVTRPQKELQAFTKVEVSAGASKDVRLALDKYAVSYYHETEQHWCADKGEYEVVFAASSVDVRGTVAFRLTESFTWTGV